MAFVKNNVLDPYGQIGQYPLIEKRGPTMYTCEEILGTHSAVVAFTGKAKKFLEAQKRLEEDQFERDLNDITISLKRIALECTVSEKCALHKELGEIKFWLEQIYKTTKDVESCDENHK